MSSIPSKPKIYYIAHCDRVLSIAKDNEILCDREARRLECEGIEIGMTDIKERRMKNELDCYPGLYVGECVPFYFCPRSIMLYILHKANHEGLI